MKRSLILALLLTSAPLAAIAPTAIAQNETPAPIVAPEAPVIVAETPVVAPENPNKGNGKVRIEAGEGGSKTFNYDSGISELTGDVTITQDDEDFILYAQKVVSSETKNQATATQNLRVETRESTIKAVRMFADFNSKTISMVDSVVISSYGEGDGIQTQNTAARRAEKKRKPVRIACDRLDWNYETQQAVLVGNIRIVQDDSVGTCTQIVYDETKNAARLLGNVRFGNEKRQQFLTDEMTLFVDSGQTQTNAGVRLVGPVKNLADGAPKPAPKTNEQFPDPATIGNADTFPTAPPNIEKFLPKPGVPLALGKTAAKPATKAAPTKPQTPTTPETPQPVTEKPENPEAQ